MSRSKRLAGVARAAPKTVSRLKAADQRCKSRRSPPCSSHLRTSMLSRFDTSSRPAVGTGHPGRPMLSPYGAMPSLTADHRRGGRLPYPRRTQQRTPPHTTGRVESDMSSGRASGGPPRHGSPSRTPLREPPRRGVAATDRAACSVQRAACSVQRRGSLKNSRKRKTVTVSPAKPGDSPFLVDYLGETPCEHGIVQRWGRGCSTGHPF